MADTVFRVQVGAQIQTSTVTLRNDIQDVLNKIGKNNPPKITVGLSKTASRQQLTTDLNDLLKNQNIGITLGLKGGGSLRGSSGAKITKELIDITSQLSQNQAAKITLHLDTAASQKAMLAELKKLDLGVNITPNNGGGGGDVTTTYAQTQREVASLQAQANAKFAKSAPLDGTSQQFQTLQSQGQRLMQQAQQLRDAYLQSADAQKRGVTQQDFDKQVAGNNRVKDSVDRVTAAYAKVGDTQKKQDLSKQEESLRKIGQLEADIIKTRSERNKYDPSTDAYKVLNEQLNEKRREQSRLKGQYADKNNAKTDNAFYAQLMQETRGLDVVTKAQEKATAAAAKRSTISKTLSDNIEYEARKQSVGLKDTTEAGQLYRAKLDDLIKKAQEGGWSMAQFRAKLAEWKQEAKNAGAMAETASEKISRMLGEKIGYGTIALAVMKVRQALSQVYTNVVNIDAAMTELKKVTDETASAYDKFLSQSGAKARELGSTVTDVVNATAGFARLGYNLADSAELAETAIVYNNVGDGIESIDDATESVISTMQAFNITAQDSMSIADKFNQIGRQNCPAA